MEHTWTDQSMNQVDCFLSWTLRSSWPISWQFGSSRLGSARWLKKHSSARWRWIPPSLIRHHVRMGVMAAENSQRKPTTFQLDLARRWPVWRCRCHTKLTMPRRYTRLWHSWRSRRHTRLTARSEIGSRNWKILRMISAGSGESRSLDTEGCLLRKWGSAGGTGSP